MRRELIKKSKFLSLVLRHDPSVIGVELDEAGWIDVHVLLPAIQRKQPDFSRECLQEIVATNDKKRFVLSGDRTRIRAAQGHSLGVDLKIAPSRPPDELFHGTAVRSLPSIYEKGLVRGKRDYVHLSPDPEIARRVGIRHGRPVVLVIDAARMADSGYEFRLSDNCVWLTELVPAAFIRFPEEAEPASLFARQVIKNIATKMVTVGFKRRRNSFYRYSREVLQLIDIRNEYRTMGLRIGIVIRRLHRSTHPQYHNCHIRAGMQFLLPRKEEMEFNAARDRCKSHLCAGTTTTVFWACIQNHALPILDSAKTLEGVRALLASSGAYRFQIDKVLAEIDLPPDKRSTRED